MPWFERRTQSSGKLALGLFVLLVSWLLAGCAPAAKGSEPPEIHYGEDLCSDCGMIINEPRFASGYTYEAEPGRFESFIFDDIGDMLLHMQKKQALKPVGWWVHDFDSEEWIDATAAYYVMSDQIKTPMFHGIIAYKDQAAAQQKADEVGAAVLDWGNVRVEAAMMQHHQH